MNSLPHLINFLEALNTELILASVAALDLVDPLATALQTHTIFASIQKTGNSDPTLAWRIVDIDVAPHAEALRRIYGRWSGNAFGQQITVDDLSRSGVVTFLGIGSPPPSDIPVAIIFIVSPRPDFVQLFPHGVALPTGIVEIMHMREHAAPREGWRERLSERARVSDSVVVRAASTFTGTPMTARDLARQSVRSSLTCRSRVRILLFKISC